MTLTTIAGAASAAPFASLADWLESEAEASTAYAATYAADTARALDWPSLRSEVMYFGGLGRGDWSADLIPGGLYRRRGGAPDVVAAHLGWSDSETFLRDLQRTHAAWLEARRLDREARRLYLLTLAELRQAEAVLPAGWRMVAGALVRLESGRTAPKSCAGALSRPWWCASAVVGMGGRPSQPRAGPGSPRGRP